MNAQAWPSDELRAISQNDDLHVSPLRDDGVTFGTPTWIWSVAVDGRLYICPAPKEILENG